MVADGWAGARDLISAFADAGLSKFVVRPSGPPIASWATEAEWLAGVLLDLQT